MNTQRDDGGTAEHRTLKTAHVPRLGYPTMRLPRWLWPERPVAGDNQVASNKEWPQEPHREDVLDYHKHIRTMTIVAQDARGKER